MTRDELKQRHEEIVRLVKRGKTPQEVAAMFRLSEGAVRYALRKSGLTPVSAWKPATSK